MIVKAASTRPFVRPWCARAGASWPLRNLPIVLGAGKIPATKELHSGLIVTIDQMLRRARLGGRKSTDCNARSRCSANSRAQPELFSAPSRIRLRRDCHDVKQHDKRSEFTPNPSKHRLLDKAEQDHSEFLHAPIFACSRLRSVEASFANTATHRLRSSAGAAPWLQRLQIFDQLGTC